MAAQVSSSSEIVAITLTVPQFKLRGFKLSVGPPCACGMTKLFRCNGEDDSTPSRSTVEVEGGWTAIFRIS